MPRRRAHGIGPTTCGGDRAGKIRQGHYSGGNMTTADQDGGAPRFERAFLGVLLSGGALAGMAQMAIVPALPQLAARYADGGDGTFIAQQVMTVAGPAMAVGGPLLGWLAGFTGKRNMLLLSSLLYAVAGLA